MALKNFDPDILYKSWTDEKYNPTHNGKTFEQCIQEAFNLPKSDKYVYRAQGETTLALTQRAINGKDAHGMHNWYHDENGQPVRNSLPNLLISTAKWACRTGSDRARTIHLTRPQKK